MPEPAAAIQSNAYLRKLLRRMWKTWHVEDALPTASILRYTQTGGTPSAGIAPTAALVANLANLEVAVSQPGKYRMTNRGGDFVELREGAREFVFIDLPATSGVAAGTMLATDVISFEGRRWQVLDDTLQNDTAIGLSYALCVLVTR